MFEKLMSPFRRTPKTAPEPDSTNLIDPENIADFATVSTTRLARQDACRLHNGGVLLLNPDDVKSAFSNKTFSNEPSRFSAIAPRNSEKYVAAKVAANIPPFQDATRHAVVRKWLSKSVFTTLNTMRPTIDPAAARYVAQLPAQTPLLLVETVGRGFATSMICDFAGVKIEQDEVKTYTAALFKLFAPVHDASSFDQTNAALAAARTALIAQFRGQADLPDPCLLRCMRDWAHLLDDLNLSDDDLNVLMADNILLVLADGVENVEAAIGNVVHAWASLPADQRPDISETFVRDCIRAATPGQTIARIASQDMHLGGIACPAGSPVFLSLAAANARTTDGTDFSFGMGRHRCIGEGLAIETILACCRHIAQRNPFVDTAAATFEPVFGHRWMRNATVTLDDGVTTDRP